MTPEHNPEDGTLGGALGKAIRLRRVELDLSRTDLARDADLSYAYVAEIENGTKPGSSKALWKIARALGLELHELMAAATQWDSRTSPPPPPPPTESLDAVDAVSTRMVEPERRSRRAVSASSKEAPPAKSKSRWFHASAASARSETAQPLSYSAPPTGDPSAVTGSPELIEVLNRLSAALTDVPDERAELALMLTLDERRTRRIVREELDRRGDSAT